MQTTDDTSLDVPPMTQERGLGTHIQPMYTHLDAAKFRLAFGCPGVCVKMSHQAVLLKPLLKLDSRLL